MNFAARLVSTTVAVLVVTVLSLVFAANRSLRRDLAGESRASLERDAQLVLRGLAQVPDSAGWQSFVRRSARAAGLRITLIDSSGRVRAESDVAEAELGRIENHAKRPEVVDALSGRIGSDVRTSTTVGKPYLYVAIKGGPGAIRVAIPDEVVESTIRQAQRLVLLAAGFSLVLGTALAWWTARRIASPLDDIGTAVQSIARGQSPNLGVVGIPDIDRLSGRLRDMHHELATRFDALRRKQAETTAIVDSMLEGVLSCGAKGEIITANPAARRFLGYGDQDELPPLPILLRSKDAQEALDQALAGESVADREVTMGDRTYLLNARPLPAGGTVVVIHDLTRLKRLETVRRDFVANASHELKTPLTAISGYAETLLADRTDPAITRQFLETILANARRMQRLVDDQLDLSRIESGGWLPTREHVAIEPAAREAWGLLVGAGPARPALVVTLDPIANFVTADPDALRQVLGNLLENAARYAPSGTVTVSARAEPGFTRISISDTGTGITSEHLPRIFERFYRVDPGRSREQGGTGLGLAIVKHLVEGHGGRVEAESELGRGTTIHTWWAAP